MTDLLPYLSAFLLAMAAVGWWAAYTEREKVLYWKRISERQQADLEASRAAERSLIEKIPEMMSPWLAAAGQTGERKVQTTAERRVLMFSDESKRFAEEKLVAAGHTPAEARAAVAEAEAKYTTQAGGLVP